SALIFLFIFGKDFIKSDKLKSIAFGVAIGICALSYLTYGGLNRISADDSKTVEYEAEITDFDYFTRSADNIYFINSQGIEVKIEYYSDIIYLEETILPDEAEFIRIREIQGGFGYTIYEVLGFK
ncbi:MAG: hypothetical protein IKW45_06785, partial [Clostridia bacterium]|nr:hypothetical protein [Clostridia bacterium]